jgi:hypothetical protein
VLSKYHAPDTSKHQSDLSRDRAGTRPRSKQNAVSWLNAAVPDFGNSASRTGDLNPGLKRSDRPPPDRRLQPPARAPMSQTSNASAPARSVSTLWLLVRVTRRVAMGDTGG